MFTEPARFSEDGDSRDSGAGQRQSGFFTKKTAMRFARTTDVGTNGQTVIVIEENDLRARFDKRSKNARISGRFLGIFDIVIFEE